MLQESQSQLHEVQKYRSRLSAAFSVYEEPVQNWEATAHKYETSSDISFVGLFSELWTMLVVQHYILGYHPEIALCL